MSSLLLVEDAAALAELFAEVLRIRQGHDVEVCVAVEDVELALQHGTRASAQLVDPDRPEGWRCISNA